ncbi:MAG: response regulator [Sandaracinaceae bacterium]|nr:response regulator [Sandaracinaceae bacterium]
MRVTGRFEQKDGHRRLLGAIADVSERRTLEEALSRSQRLESLGRLAGGVAHDFNNLLTVIMASLSLAGDELQSGPAKAELSTARSAADRARELTRQLMAFARRQVVELSVVELHAHLGELGPMLRRLLGEDVELVLRLDPDAGAVRVDASQIEQVLVNLAVNAREAMPRGGRLEIETAAEVIDAARGASLDVAEGSYVVIRVRDTGMGMDEHTRARAFDPFFTTKADGTGLGLASVFGIVRRLSGAIVLDSELGRGTEVSVYLPRVEEHVRPSAEAPRAAAHGAGQRILLVEDDDLVRSAGARILARLGYRVEVAAHGAQALEILAAASTPFDLLMTDMIMPGMTGVELADEVRRIQPGIAVLVVSGYADVDNEQLAGHTYLQKPYSLETLSQRLGELFSGRAPKRSA